MPLNKNGAVEREIHINALPNEVFAYWTDSEKLKEWKGVQATLEPHQGGLYRVHVTANDVVRGEFLEVTPPSRIVFTWGWEGDQSPLPPGASTVEVNFDEQGGGTLLRVRHYGFVIPALVEMHSEGWDRYLPRLVEVMEGNAGRA